MIRRNPVIQETWGPAEYFADERVSRSDLVQVLESSAVHYGKKTGAIADEESAAMRFGTAVHLAALEPEEAERLLVEEQKFDCRRKGQKEAKAEYLASLPDGAMVFSGADLDRVRACVAALRAHRQAAQLLFGEGPVEFSITWDEAGIGARARLDKVRKKGRRALVVDLKTASDPSPAAFQKAAINHGYVLQPAWYTRALPELLGVDEVSFAFVVVRSSPPHEVAVYVPDKDFLDLGERRVAEALDLIKRCRECGDWSPAWQLQTNTISPPRWAL